MRRKYKKRKQQINQIIICIATVLLVITAGIGTTLFTGGIDDTRFVFSRTKPKKTEEATNKEVSLLVVGDNLLHMPIVRNGEMPNGNYNFDSLYEKMRPSFLSADIAVIVQETILGGKELGYSGYPLFNTPQEVGDAIQNAGFDVVLHATNHALDQGEKGIKNALAFWKKHPEITVLGIKESKETYDKIDYIEKNGIKLAVFNYTDSTNGIPLPSDKPYLLHVVDKEEIATNLAVAEKNADFTVVFMHWGDEYSFRQNEAQKELASKMCENGADLIIGSHPHVLQPTEWIQSPNGNKALVYYSLGNYVSRQKEVPNLLGAIAEVKICSREERGTCIDAASLTPTVTHYNANSRGFYVYPLKDYTDELASAHGVAKYDGKVTVERFRKIFEDVYAGNTSVSLIY